jgi:hypothetical protein
MHLARPVTLPLIRLWPIHSHIKLGRHELTKYDEIGQKIKIFTIEADGSVSPPFDLPRQGCEADRLSGKARQR